MGWMVKEGWYDYQPGLLTIYASRTVFYISWFFLPLLHYTLYGEYWEWLMFSVFDGSMTEFIWEETASGRVLRVSCAGIITVFIHKTRVDAEGQKKWTEYFLLPIALHPSVLCVQRGFMDYINGHLHLLSSCWVCPREVPSRGPKD